MIKKLIQYIKQIIDLYNNDNKQYNDLNYNEVREPDYDEDE